MEGGDVTSDSANPLNRLKLNMQTMKGPVVEVHYLMIFFFLIKGLKKTKELIPPVSVPLMQTHGGWPDGRKAGSAAQTLTLFKG